MQVNFSYITGLVIAAWVGILIIPFAVGLNLLTKAKRHEWYMMAGLLTLLPVLTGPIWFALWSAGAASYHFGEAFLTVLPGVILTGIIAIRFHRCFFGSVSYAARVLLILGCMRWLSSFIIGAAPAFHIDSGLFVVIGIALPTVFAIVAVSLSTTVKWATA